MATAGDILLSKSSLSSGATASEHLQSIVVGTIDGTSGTCEVVSALEVQVAEAVVLQGDVGLVEASTVEVDAVVPNLDQKLTEAILPIIETQVVICP